MSDLAVMLHPDDLDIKIMRELESPASFRWNVRESYASIAKKLGIDEETVGRRVERVRQAGVFQGWELIVNPHIIGRESASMELDVDPELSKEAVVEKLKLMEGVVSILNFNGRHLQVGLYFRNRKSLERQVALILSICGSKDSLLLDVDFPSFHLRMTSTDWLILNSLRKNPRVKLADLARDIAVSTRTLNRRMSRMIEGYAFFLHTAMDLRRLGGLACRLLIQSGNPAKKRAADEAILKKLNKIEWIYTVSDNYSMFVMHCENTAEADQISGWASGMSGIDRATMDIIDDQITVQDWLDEEIEGRISL
jgi:DNA-binding Lrp family transcriptional regulator